VIASSTRRISNQRSAISTGMTLHLGKFASVATLPLGSCFRHART
jgi:hypothetical protein